MCLAALTGCDLILHAGDVGGGVLEPLGLLAPVHAVRGNNDTAGEAALLPDVVRLELAGRSVVVVHRLVDAPKDLFDILVFGHCHRRHEYRASRRPTLPEPRRRRPARLPQRPFRGHPRTHARRRARYLPRARTSRPADRCPTGGRALTARRTKIVATLGPASHRPETIAAMLRAGMDVVRLNTSHGTMADHLETVSAVRRIAAEERKAIGVLMDLSGPKLRTGLTTRRASNSSSCRATEVTPHEHARRRATARIVSVEYPRLTAGCALRRPRPPR